MSEVRRRRVRWRVPPDLPAGHPVPPVQVAGYVEAVAQDHCDMPVIAKRLTEWAPVR
ncbi:hypothetical protein ACH4K5_28905 [Streptomyces albidoflavus]